MKEKCQAEFEGYKCDFDKKPPHTEHCFTSTYGSFFKWSDTEGHQSPKYPVIEGHLTPVNP